MSYQILQIKRKSPSHKACWLCHIWIEQSWKSIRMNYLTCDPSPDVKPMLHFLSYTLGSLLSFSHSLSHHDSRPIRHITLTLTSLSPSPPSHPHVLLPSLSPLPPSHHRALLAIPKPYTRSQPYPQPRPSPSTHPSLQSLPQPSPPPHSSRSHSSPAPHSPSTSPSPRSGSAPPPLSSNSQQTSAWTPRAPVSSPRPRPCSGWRSWPGSLGSAEWWPRGRRRRTLVWRLRGRLRGWQERRHHLRGLRRRGPGRLLRGRRGRRQGAAACRSSRWGWAVCIERVSSDGVGDVVAWEMTLLHSVHWFKRAFEERADKHV